jgi:hypothetical protein
MKHLFTILMLLTIAVSQAQYLAGAVDTTFILNNDGVPLSTNGYHRVTGVEVVGNSVYYAFSTNPGSPAVRKFDFQGNEDESWYTNQMSTWGAQFATFSLEPEKDATGNYTGEFFICGRNSFNSMVNQGVRFLNKINADGTRDLNFVCPNTSWINICSAVYHDWENNKLYYSYQSGYSEATHTQNIVCCDPNTGQILQTITLPSPTGLIRKITKQPGTNDLILGGDLDFNLNGNQYDGLFKLTEQFTIVPIEGITNLSNNFVVADILFVNDTECDGTSTGMKVYVAGSGNMMSGVSSLRGIARFTLTNNIWTIDSNYNAGCNNPINDIVYYNCHLIATGNFTSSTPTGPYTLTWTPKITAFTSDGQLSPEFKMANIGYGLGGNSSPGFEGSLGHGSGNCLAVNPTNDGNNRWEIFAGGSFMSVVQGPSSPSILQPANCVAKLYGFRNLIDPRFTYCLDDIDNGKYILSTFNTTPTSGCEKWELFESTTPNSNWTLIDTKTTPDFTSMGLAAGMWYKIVRTVTECGNSCSSSYTFYRDVQNCEPQNNGVELRSLISSQQPTQTIESEAIDISIYPNPAFGLVTITDGYGAGFRNLDIYNSLGIKILTTSVNTEIYQIDMSKFPSGVYMIVVTAKEGVKKQQVIKE